MFSYKETPVCRNYHKERIFYADFYFQQSIKDYINARKDAQNAELDYIKAIKEDQEAQKELMAVSEQKDKEIIKKTLEKTSLTNEKRLESKKIYEKLLERSTQILKIVQNKLKIC